MVKSGGATRIVVTPTHVHTTTPTTGNALLATAAILAFFGLVTYALES